ncbi:MAG: hypothetical protein E4H38_06370 [Gemmatimonadales bacterium]|nr:MAG: hypothetical protein E4H38_06370 [Gemmatimonadales bacterium]
MTIETTIDKDNTEDPFSGVREDVFAAIATPDIEEETPVVDPEPATPGPEAEAEPVVPEAVPQEEAPAPEAEPAPPPTPTAKTIRYKFSGEEKELDPFADEKETARLVQLGMDYDKKTGLNEAITKGIVRYDLESGGLVAGPAVEQAKTDTALKLLNHFKELGLVEMKGGQWVPLAVAKPDPTPTAASVAELEAIAHEEGTAEAVMAWQKALFAEERQAKQAVTQQQSAQTELETALATADTMIDELAKKLSAQFTDHEGKPDQAVIAREVKLAKQLTRQRDQRGTYQFATAQQGLKEAAALHAARTKAVVDRIRALTPAHAQNGRPAAAPTSAKKAPVKVDPDNPFAEIDMESRLAPIYQARKR